MFLIFSDTYVVDETLSKSPWFYAAPHSTYSAVRQYAQPRMESELLLGYPDH